MGDTAVVVIIMAVRNAMMAAMARALAALSRAKGGRCGGGCGGRGGGGSPSALHLAGADDVELVVIVIKRAHVRLSPWAHRARAVAGALCPTLG